MHCSMEGVLHESCVLGGDFAICGRLSPSPRSPQFCHILGKRCGNPVIRGKPEVRWDCSGRSSTQADWKDWVSSKQSRVDSILRRGPMSSLFGSMRRESRASRFSKKLRSAKLVVRVLGFLRSRRKQRGERRKQAYVALLSLGFRLFLLSQADRFSMLRDFWNEHKAFLDAETFGGGGKSGTGLPGTYGGGDEDHEFSQAPASKKNFLLSFFYLCAALLVAAFTFVMVLSPASVVTLSWLVDCLMSLAMVLSAGLLSFWMLRTAAYMVLSIFKSSTWLFTELKESVRQNATGTATVLLLSIPAALAFLPRNRAVVHKLVMQARAVALNLAYRLKNLRYRRSKSAALVSTACSKVRSVFKRSR